MQRWAIVILFSAILMCPVMSALADGALDCELNFPTLSVPLESASHSGSDVMKKPDEDAKMKEKKEKELRDKRVDDAIKKAWEEK